MTKQIHTTGQEIQDELSGFNERNATYTEVRNHICRLPERAKELITKHIQDDNCSNDYTEYTYDVGGKYFVTDALQDVEEALEGDFFANEGGRVFYAELKAVLDKITCDTIEYEFNFLDI